jgi:hypothetical protein
MTTTQHPANPPLTHEEALGGRALDWVIDTYSGFGGLFVLMGHVDRPEAKRRLAADRETLHDYLRLGHGWATFHRHEERCDGRLDRFGRCGCVDATEEYGVIHMRAVPQGTPGAYAVTVIDN